MAAGAHPIERLALPPGGADLRGLARLLVAVVESGAAVSFLPPLTVAEAEGWWRGATSEADPRAVVLVARSAERIVGTVQLHPAWAPNQPHRGEISKLLVDGRCRRQGLGAQLMGAIEKAAAEEGFRLLTLDAKRGAAAEHLYRRLGWTAAGTIPRYAHDPDGTAHDAVLFYKEVGSAEASGEEATQTSGNTGPGGGEALDSGPDRPRESPSEPRRRPAPSRTIAHVALVVRDYDEAIAFYTERLGFELIADAPRENGKRWVLVAPRGNAGAPGPTGTTLLLARAVGPEQESRIGNQTGGRVFLFLHTDDFQRDVRAFREQGVRFVRPPKDEPYGTVAVFEDLHGNLWDLIQPAEGVAHGAPPVEARSP